MSDASDEELVAAWQDGDAAAFDEIVTRFSARVFGICYRYFGDAQDAEEAAQETFLVLHRRGSSFRGQSKFSTWLYRVTTNVCHDLGRKRARRVDTVPMNGAGEPGQHLADAPGAEDALVAAELGSEISAALRDLEETQRTAVILHDVYGYPYDDIAARTGVALGTAKSRVHRGHARLAEALVHLRRQQPAQGGPPAAGRQPRRRERSAPNEHLTE